MTTFNILDENDIKNIIAKYFTTDNRNVSLEIYDDVEGCGISATAVQKVQIKVKIPTEI